jgi:CubicO group peptidase (beta-lactamase class C family)
MSGSKLTTALESGEFGDITSVVVFRAGEIVYEAYGDRDPDALRNTRSCTKTVLGMLVGIALDRGLVPGAETPLSELLGGLPAAMLYPDPRKQEISVRDVLTMRSSLECDDWSEFSAGNEERMYPREDWVQFFFDLPIRGGRGFSYCTAGVVTLGVALERAVGEPLPSFAARELFVPLGIERAEWPTTPLGQTATGGGLLLTSRSLAELGRMYLRAGLDVVPRAWVEESVRPHARIDEQTAYGYLWWLRAFDGHPCFYMTGMGGNRVHVFPGLDAVVVITSLNFARRDAHALSDRLLGERVLPLLA